MQLKILLILLTAFSLNLSAYSQTRINGQVIAAADKKPLAEVSVSIQGKNIGTVTNDEGRFSLIASISNPDTLVISYLGYKAQKIAFATIATNFVIQLDTLIQQLTEVKIKPLGTKQLFDSIVTHNQKLFLNPVKLNGYYREFVFTNNKCTEYADALTSFFNASDKSSYQGQLKIVASRCAEAKEDNNKDKSSAKEFYVDSKVSPNNLFELAMLYKLTDKYLPEKSLNTFNYTLANINNSDDQIVTIFPKTDDTKNIYRVTFVLTQDFGIKSYRIEIDPKKLDYLPERSLLGIHVKLLKKYLEVNYSQVGDKIYPSFFKYDVSLHVGGKFLGTVLNQTYNPKSEYVTTDISSDLKPFTRNEIYKKGNLCDNGAAINDALLKSHNFITQSRKDSLAISQTK